MNFIDIVIIVPVLWGGYIGYKKGLIIEVISLVALGFGIWGGIHFSDLIGDLLREKINSEYVSLTAFVITFAVIVMTIYFIGKMLEKLVNLVQMKLLNKLAGIVFGVGKVALIISVLVLIINSYDKNNKFIPQKAKDESLLLQPLEQFSLKMIPAIQESKVYSKNIPSQ